MYINSCTAVNWVNFNVCSHTTFTFVVKLVFWRSDLYPCPFAIFQELYWLFDCCKIVFFALNIALTSTLFWWWAHYWFCIIDSLIFVTSFIHLKYFVARGLFYSARGIFYSARGIFYSARGIFYCARSIFYSARGIFYRHAFNA